MIATLTISPQNLRALVEIEREKRRRKTGRDTLAPIGSNPATLVDRDPVRWLETHFFIPETRGPLQLAPYQQQVLREAFTPDPDGTLPYSTIVWSDIKKSIKSTVAAGICLWWAWQIDASDGWGSEYVIANDLKQADSRIFYYLRRAIQLNPTLRERCTVRTGQYKVTLLNQTFIEAIPIDPSGEAGANADAVFFSELWGAHSEKQQQMWTEATLPPNKYGRSFRWVETYAGYTGSSPLLEQLYEATVKTGRRLDPDLELFDNPNGRMLTLWNTVPRLAWQTDDYYNQERATLLPKEFERVHRNQWSDGSASPFLDDMSLWHACADPTLPPLDNHTPCVLALDAGESNDTFACVLVSAWQDGLAVRYSRAYVPTPGTALDFDAIERDIRDLISRYAIQELTYDPFLLGQFIRRLTTHDPVPAAVTPFPQGQQRLASDKGLYDLITTRRLAHDGQQAQLTEHLANADKKLDAAGHMRIVKRAYRLKIDLAVALGMAAHRAGLVLARKSPPPLQSTSRNTW